MRAMRQGREWALARVARGALRTVIWRPDPCRPARTICHVRPPREDKKDSLTMIDSSLFFLLLSGRELLSSHELPRLLDEAISEEEQLDMDLAEGVCQRLLEWDLGTQETSMGEVRTRLAQVLGRGMDSSEDE